MNIVALTIFSQKILRNASPAAEAVIRVDLLRAVATLSDLSFISRTNDGISGEMPASVTYGAASTAASGSLKADVSALLDTFSGSLDEAVWIAHPLLAAQMAMTDSSINGGLGPRGGEYLGMPFVTSQGVEYDSNGGTLILLDPTSVVVVDEGVDIRISTVASIEMDNEPTGDTLSPSAMTKNFVSLFQSDSAALLTTRAINWELARADAVSLLTGCDYGS